MNLTRQPMLRFRQSVRPDQVKSESQRELVRLLAELLMQQLKRERAEKQKK